MRRSRIAALAAAALAAGWLAAAAGGSRGGVIWNGNFETGGLSQYSEDVQCAAAGRAQVVDAPVRRGRHAVRLHVEQGDVVLTQGSDRCDLYVYRPETLGVEGREQWWAWSTLFPKDFHPTPDTDWNVVQDFHNSGSTGMANTMITVNTIGRRPMPQLSVFGGDPAHPSELRRNVAPLSLDRWYDFVFHVRWSSDAGTGFVQLWVNRRLVFPLRHLATLYPGQTTYFKLANYRPSYALGSSVIDDEVRLARTRSALRAR